MMLTTTFAERGGYNNEYILIKTNEASRWICQYGSSGFDYLPGESAGPSYGVQILTNGHQSTYGNFSLYEPSTGTNGSNGTCVWTPLKHEIVIVYDLKKLGDNDPAGGFDLSTITNLSVLIRNYRQGIPVTSEKDSPSSDDIRPVIYVEQPTGANSPIDGWYFLSNNLHQRASTTNWETIVFSGVFSNGHVANSWVSRLDQKNLVVSVVPSKTNSFFRFERFWLGSYGVNSNASETTTLYSFTGGTISAVGLAVVGVRGTVTNRHWHQISGSIKIDEIRLY